MCPAIDGFRVRGDRTYRFGLPERDLRDNIALEDGSVVPFILIDVARRYLRSNCSTWRGFGSTFQT